MSELPRPEAHRSWAVPMLCVRGQEAVALAAALGAQVLVEQIGHPHRFTTWTVSHARRAAIEPRRILLPIACELPT